MKEQRLESIIGIDLYAQAKATLGNPEAVEKWFYSPKIVFGGETPLEVYKAGKSQEIYGLLGRIENGIFY